MTSSLPRKGAFAWAAIALLALWPLLAVPFRQSPPVIAGLVAALLVAAVATGDKWQRLHCELGELVRDPMVGLLAIALVLIWVSTLWSPVPGHAVLTAGQVSVAAALCLLLAILARAVPNKLAGQGALVAALVGVVALVMMYALYGRSGELATIQYYVRRTNRAAVLLALMMPGALWFARARFGGAGALALAGLMALAVFLSNSESAKLAVAVMAAVWLLHRLFGVAAVWLVAALSILVVLLAPLIGANIYALIPGWLFRHTDYITFGVRADIWREFSLLALAKPWFGWGLEASTAPFAAIDAAAFSEAQKKALTIGHTHNAPLQIWFELGLAGAVLAAGMIGLLAQRLVALAPDRRAPVVALACGVFAVSAVSHGAWQVWWFCLIGAVAVLLPRRRWRD